MKFDELAKAYIELYDEIDGVSDEMSSRDHRLVNEHWPIYQALKEQLGEVR